MFDSSHFTSLNRTSDKLTIVHFNVVDFPQSDFCPKLNKRKTKDTEIKYFVKTLKAYSPTKKVLFVFGTCLYSIII